MARRRHFIAEAPITISRKDRLDDEPISGLKVQDLKIELDPAVIAAINEDLDEIHRSIKEANIKGTMSYKKLDYEKIEDVELNNDVVPGEIAIPHSFGYVPLYYHVNPKKHGVNWWETKPADEHAIYLRAAGPLFVDVIIRG